MKGSGVNMLYSYPAIFNEEDNNYFVTFPDLEGCFSQGDNEKEAIENAMEALELYLEPNDPFNTPLEFPTPSSIKEISSPENGFVSYVSVEIDLSKYSKSYKKTLTIPYWLNKEAEEKGINFSEVLQSALLEMLEKGR